MNSNISFIIHDLEPALASFSSILRLLKNKKLNMDNQLHQNLIESSDLALSYARNLLETLLEQERIGKKKMELRPVSIIWDKDYPKMTALSKLLAVDKNIELINDISARDLETTSDRRLLERIINNLLINAIKYSPSNSRVITRIDKKNNLTRISVQDEGPGLSGQLTGEGEKLVKGFGLGLDFCKKAARVLGGSLSVKKNSSLGVRFELKIPEFRDRS